MNALLENMPLFYLVFLGGSILFSIMINELLLKFSKNLGTRHKDDLLRWNAESKPSVGGLSFYIIFLISLCLLSLLHLPSETMDNDMMLGIFGSTLLGFMIGLADDAFNTRPLLKFLGQLLAANILVTSGIIIEVTPDLTINYIFTIVWVIGIMNSINMLDNMDGVTAIVSLSIIASILTVIFLHEGLSDSVTLLLLGVATSLIGFLVFNWHPSKMFMGDTGSQFLGVFLAGISIVYLWGFRNETNEYVQLKQFVLPLLAFIVPIIDTATVFIRRILRGKSPFVGGRDHTTHQLSYLGLSDGTVAFIMFAISSVSTFLIYFIFQLAEEWSYVYTYAAFGYFITVFTIMQILYNKGLKRHRESEAAAAVQKTGTDASE